MDTGALSGASAASINNGDTNAWINPTNALTSNNSRAALQIFGSDGLSDSLAVYNFSASLPDGASVVGVAVAIECRKSEVTTETLSVTLAKTASSAASVVSDTKTSTSVTTSDSVISFGGATDLWGVSWTAAEFNASGFGVWVQYDSGVSDDLFEVDYVSVTLYYETGGGGAQVIFIGV